MSARTKLILYMIALLVLQIQTGTADYTAEDVETWQPWDWFKLVIAIFGSLALSASMFFDQSVSHEHAEELSKRRIPEPQQTIGGMFAATPTTPAATPNTNP